MAARTKALVAWLERHGGYVHPDLDLFAELPNGDRGVRASKDIKEGDQLILVPKACCIYVRDHGGAKAQTQPDSKLLELVRGLGLSPFLSTVLLVLAARAQGADGEYWAYIDSLPERHDCLLSWSEDERALLQGTDLDDRKESAADVFEREVAPLLAAHPGTWPPSACEAAAFEWACGMVQSRAFHLVKENWVTQVKSEGTDLYLIPGIDMINHATVPARRATALKLVEEPLTVRCGEPLREVTLQGYFTMRADRDIAAGEEVLHTYGDLSDAQLLQTYGFVEEWGPGEENPHNAVFIPSETLVEACGAIAAAMGLDTSADGGETGTGSKRAGGGKGGGRKRKGRGGAEGDGEEGKGQGGGGGGGAAESRRAVLERLGLLPPNVFVVPAEAPLSEELLTVAQVLLMPPEDFKEYAAEFKAEPAQQPGQPSSSGGGEGGPPGEHVVRGVLGRSYLEDADFREAVCFALLKAVQACLRRYGSTAEEDEALLAAQGAAAGGGGDGGGGLGWRGVCAVRVRLGEKRVLARLKREVMALLAEGAEGSDDEEGSSGSEEGSDSDLEGSGSELGSEDLGSSSGNEGGSGSGSESDGEEEAAPKKGGGGRGRGRGGARRPPAARSGKAAGPGHGRGGQGKRQRR